MPETQCEAGYCVVVLTHPLLCKSAQETKSMLRIELNRTAAVLDCAAIFFLIVISKASQVVSVTKSSVTGPKCHSLIGITDRPLMILQIISGKTTIKI